MGRHRPARAGPRLQGAARLDHADLRCRGRRNPPDRGPGQTARIGAGVRPLSSRDTPGSVYDLGDFDVDFAIASIRPTREWRTLRCPMPPNEVSSLSVSRSGMSLAGAAPALLPGDVSALASNRALIGMSNILAI